MSSESIKLRQYYSDALQVFFALQEQARIGLKCGKVLVRKRNLLNFSKIKPLTDRQKLKLKKYKLKITELRREFAKPQSVIANYRDITTEIMSLILDSNMSLLEIKAEQLILWLRHVPNRVKSI